MPTRPGLSPDVTEILSISSSCSQSPLLSLILYPPRRMSFLHFLLLLHARHLQTHSLARRLQHSLVTPHVPAFPRAVKPTLSPRFRNWPPLFWLWALFAANTHISQRNIKSLPVEENKLQLESDFSWIARSCARGTPPKLCTDVPPPPELGTSMLMRARS